MCAVFHRSVVGAVLVALWASSAIASETDAYFARRIWTATGETIEDGVLIVVDGKITAIGPQASTPVPEGAKRHDLKSHVIIPGLVVAHTNLSGGDTQVEHALTPESSALDGFDFFADRTDALSGGVTTVQLSPSATRLMPGVGAVVKLGESEADRRVLRQREGLRIVLSDESRDPPTIYEPPVGPVSVDRPILPTRPQLSRSLGGAVAGLRVLLRAAREQPNAAPGDEPLMNALASHLAAGGTVRMTANTATEIRLALDLARDFELSLVLEGPTELDPLAGDFANWSNRVQGVVLTGRRPGAIRNPSPARAKDEADPWDQARELVDAGLRLAIRPAADEDLSDLLFVAGQFRQGDLSPEQALQAITRWPAEMMGVADRVGTLDTGLAADFVVLSEDPFATHSHVLATYVDGKTAYRRDTIAHTTLIRADSVYIGDGEVLAGADVVVKGKTIRAIGEVSAPPGARVKSYPGAVIVPGFIDLGSGLGLGGALGDDISLETRLGEQIYPNDPAIEIARQGGVTTVLFGSSSDSASPLVAFKLGDDTRVVADPVGLRFAITDDLHTTVPALERTLNRGKAYHERWLQYEKALAEYEARQAEKKAKAEAASESNEEAASEEAEERAEGERGEGPPEGRRPEGRRRPRGEGSRGNGAERRGRQEPSEESETGDEGQDQEESTAEGEKAESEDSPPEKPRSDPRLEPYRLLFSGEIPAFVEARRVDAIEAALELFREQHDLRTILVGVDDLARFPDLLSGHEVSVVAGPDLMVTRDHQRTNLPQLLANEGIPFGFQSRATTGVRDLPAVVQYTVSQGLSPGDALRALSASPAGMISDAATFGTLKAGHDADLVVLSGPPFDLATKVLAVMIDGRWVYERESER